MPHTDLVASFLQALGIVALSAMVFETAQRYCPNRRCRVVAVTLALCAGLAGSMNYPIEVDPGIYFDLRHVFLVIAPLFGGVIASAMTTVTALSMRYYQGGFGLPAGIAGILISAAVGLVFAHFVPRHKLTLQKTSVLALSASISIASLFVLPWTIAIVAFKKIAGHILVANFVGVMMAAGILNKRQTQVMREQELTKQATLDPLTGLKNRRTFDAYCLEISEVAESSGIPCTVMMIDIDHFKRVNDTFGHPAGDEVIRRVATIVASHARKDDLMARYGGEEVAAVFFGLDTTQTRLVAERIRSKVEAAVTTIRGIPISVTISIGFASLGDKSSFKEAVDAADKALYKAKNSGRNQVMAELAA